MNDWRAQFCSLHFLTMCKNNTLYEVLEHRAPSTEHRAVSSEHAAHCPQCTAIKDGGERERVSIKKRIWCWWDETRFTSIIIIDILRLAMAAVLGKAKAQGTHSALASSCYVRKTYIRNTRCNCARLDCNHLAMTYVNTKAINNRWYFMRTTATTEKSHNKEV